MIALGIVLVVIGMAFLDTSGIVEAYRQGVEFGSNN
jgi:hypothetical protein